jgi:two-component system, cell cycle response regulator CtrA
MRFGWTENDMRLLVLENPTSAWAPPICDDRSFVVRADTPDEGLSILRHDTVDMVVVDLTSLVDRGLAFIRQLRAARDDTPLVALTGLDANTRVRALGLGADDAIAHPVDPDEFWARLAAVVRRYRGFSQSSLQCGDLVLSSATREVRFREVPLHLPYKEYSMLELLVLRQGTVVTKDLFLNHLYGGLDEPDPKLIDVFICKLRKKLATLGANDLIGTIRGKGYTLRKADRRNCSPVPADCSETPSHRTVLSEMELHSDNGSVTADAKIT